MILLTWCQRTKLVSNEFVTFDKRIDQSRTQELAHRSPRKINRIDLI